MQPVGTVTELTPQLIAYLREHNDELHDLRWDVFERLVAELLKSRGFERVQLAGQRGDTAADIVATQLIDPLGIRLRYFVEVKRWKNKIGVEVVDRVLGAMLAERPSWGWHLAMIVTLAGVKNMRKYTRRQLQFLGIEIRDQSDIAQWLEDYSPNENGLWLHG